MRNEQRLPPRTPPFPDDVQRTLERMMGKAQDIEPLALFRTLAHNEVLLDRFRGLGSAMLAFGHLPDDERETLIHRTTARCGADYEWGVHATLFAQPLGLGEQWLRATWCGAADDPAFTPRQALLARAADELHDESVWSEATWSALRASYDDETLIEIVCLAGFYHVVSYLCGAFAITPETWAEQAPPASHRTAHARAGAFVTAYGNAWERWDVDAFAELFSDDVVYVAHPDETVVGAESLRRYLIKEQAAQGAVSVRMGSPMIEANRVMAEFWVDAAKDGKEAAITGCLIAHLDPEYGLCTHFREYWFDLEGPASPFETWGT